MPDVFSAQLIKSLVYTESIMVDQAKWTEVWDNYNAVLQAFPADKRDMLPGAVDSVTNYLILYQK